MDASYHKNSTDSQPPSKICTKCHRKLPLVENFRPNKRYKGGYLTWCKQCDSDWHKAHYAKPEIKTRFKERESGEEHNAKVRKRYRERIETETGFQERVHEYSSNHWQQNKQREREWKRRKYATDPDYARRVLDTTRAWELAHPVETQQRKFRKNTRRRAAITAAKSLDLQQVIARDGHVCYLCGKDIDPALKRKDPAALVFDHVIPLNPRPGEPKGTHTLENIRPAHNCCNGRKANRRLEDLTEWDRRGPDA